MTTNTSTTTYTVQPSTYDVWTSSGYYYNDQNTVNPYYYPANTGNYPVLPTYDYPVFPTYDYVDFYYPFNPNYVKETKPITDFYKDAKEHIEKEYDALRKEAQQHIQKLTEENEALKAEITRLKEAIIKKEDIVPEAFICPEHSKV